MLFAMTLEEVLYRTLCRSPQPQSSQSYREVLERTLCLGPDGLTCVPRCSDQFREVLCKTLSLGPDQSDQYDDTLLVQLGGGFHIENPSLGPTRFEQQ